MVDEKAAGKGVTEGMSASRSNRVAAGRLRRAFPQYPIYVKKITLSR